MYYLLKHNLLNIRFKANKQILLIGNYTKLIKGIHFVNIEELINYLKKHVNYNNIIYIKGSHAMNLGKIKETFN